MAILSTIPLAQIRLSQTVSQIERRKRFSDDSLAELTESVKEHGVLQPIIVRANGDGHELVVGERRYRAAKLAGLEEIPAVVRTDLTDEAVLEVQLIENLQRADLHPMEEAEGYHELMSKHGHVVDELHARVGKSRSYVYGRLKLLALSETCRKAFYAGKISASIALLLARIPVEKIQNEALKTITEEDRWRPAMSYRQARDHIEEEFMLRLEDAPFPTDDPDLNGGVGPCGTCPKRTGNQPELFGDVKSADVCTDPVCFKAKTISHSNRLISAAREAGREVITGKAAKELVRFGVDSSIDGYMKLDEKCYRDPKYRTAKQILGKDAETTMLQDPKSGRVVEVVKESTVFAALKQKGDRPVREDDGTDRRRRAAQLEAKFRAELYTRLRAKLKPPGWALLAATLFDSLEHESKKRLCRIRGFEAPKLPYGSSHDYDAVGKTIDSLGPDELVAFVNDCIYVRELEVHTWSDAKPELLLAAAQAHDIDAKAVRREVTPKKKAKASKRKKAA